MTMGSSQSQSTSDPASQLIASGHIYVDRHPACALCKYLRMAAGVATVCLVFYSAVDSILLINRIPIGVYLFVVGVPVFLLEFGKVIRTCCGTDGACCRLFHLVLDFDRWKRGILYCLLAIPCTIEALNPSIYVRLSGVLLFVTGLLYVAKVCQRKKVPMYVVNPTAAGRSAHLSASATTMNSNLSSAGAGIAAAANARSIA